MKIFRLTCFIIFFTAMVFCYLVKLPVNEKIALQAEDIKFTIRESLQKAPVGDPKIVMVVVDEKSINRLGRFPWNRQIFATIFSRLHKANVVGLDIIFADPSLPADDSALARVIAENNNIVTGFFFRRQATDFSRPEDIDILQDSAYMDLLLTGTSIGIRDFPFSELNIPEIASAGLASGFFNTEPDIDGLYRRYSLAYLHQGYLFPPLAIQILRFYLNQDAKIVADAHGISTFRLGKSDVKKTEYLRLNYYKHDPKAYISASDIYDGSISPDFFQDKIVLVGVTEMGLFDLRPTPVNPVTPGISIHYTALANLKNNEILHGSKNYNLIFLAFGLFLVALASMSKKLSSRLILYALSISAIFTLANLFLITHNLWLREFYTLTGQLFLACTLEAVLFKRTEVKAKEMKKAFVSYVSPNVANEIIKNPDKLALGGTEQDISILFQDIRNFTTLSEQVTPEQLVEMLNEIRDPLTNIILENQGMLDKYIGDAMMALFNTPLEVENHENFAVQTALSMMYEQEKINQRFQSKGFPSTDIGIGINTGRCVVGNMGSKVRFEYTAIGDPVNLASRIEGLCKIYRCRIIISEFTQRKLSPEFLLRKLDQVQVKGKDKPVTIYEVMENTEKNKRIQEQFNEALDLYFSSNFSKAHSLFTGLDILKNDGPSIVFGKRCESFKKEPPASDWGGVWTMKDK